MPAFEGNTGPTNPQDQRTLQFTSSHDSEQQGFRSKSPTPADQFSSHKKRTMIDFDETPIHTRTSRRCFIRRPRTLQVSHHGHVVEVGDAGAIELTKDGWDPAGQHAMRETGHSSKTHTDDIRTQRGESSGSSTAVVHDLIVP